MDRKDYKSKPLLNKETNAIWTAWSHMGNREVAREAVAKGTHVELAIRFLSTRNEISKVDAETWFKNEVLMWVKELLTRKQIHRSKHILSNAGINPINELKNIFLKTTSTETRQYIGEHLSELKMIDDKTKNLWLLLNIIQSNHDKVSGFKECNSLEDILERNAEWHSKVATMLFLIEYDPHLSQFIKPLDLFKYLIGTNNESIKYWIDISFGNENTSHITINQNLVRIFREFNISQEMIEILNCDQMGLSNSLRDGIFNELCKFGVFQKDEKTNCVKLLNRFLKYDISTIYEILEQKSSALDMNKFIRMLNEYCVDNNCLAILSACASHFKIETLENMLSPHIELIALYEKMQWNCEENLEKVILSTVDYLKGCDYKEYFEKYPLILCCLILFNKEKRFSEALERKTCVGHLEISKYSHILLSKFSLLRKLSNKLKGDFGQSKKSFYHLIEDHLEIEVEKLFNFRFAHTKMPHFNCDKLVQNFGYDKKINYFFYILELRPSIATKLVLLDQLQLYDSCSYSDSLQEISEKLFISALNNFCNNEMACSCICFQEMVGLPSIHLRVHLKIANALLEAGFNEAHCKDMFKHFESTPYEIQNALETSRLENVLFGFEIGREFVDAKNAYDIVIKFSSENNIKYPEAFLRNCAIKNDWLSFLIFAQIHNYPLEQIKEVGQCFKNPFYLEHILHCVTYDILIDDQNTLMRERDLRKSFLSRIGVRQSAETINQSDSRSAYKSQSSYTMSDSSDILEINILNTKATLLQTLIRCHNSSDPPRALLQACQLYRNPILAIFATSYEPDSIHTNWLTWLVVSCEIYQNFTNLEGLVMSAGTTQMILVKGMDKKFPLTLLKSFEIFLPDNSLKHLLKFLCLGLQHNFDSSMMSNELKLLEKSWKYCRTASLPTGQDHEISYLVNRCWLEETSITLIASALEYNCNSGNEQILFLKTMCELGIQNVFSIENPDFSGILETLTILHKSKTKTRFDLSTAFKASLNKDSIIPCVNSLLEEKQFDIALKVAEINHLCKDLVILMQWHDIFENKIVGDNFLENCNRSFKEHKVTADRVIEFFSSIYEKVNSNSEKYEIFKYSYEWARDFDLSTKYELEKDMWLNYINLEEKIKNVVVLPKSIDCFLFKDMMDLIELVPVCYRPLPKDIDFHLEKLISAALEKEDFFLALRLEKMFSYENPDIDILKVCYSLAEGLQMPYQLSGKQKMFMNRSSNFRRYGVNRRTILSSRLSGVSSASHSPSMSASLLNVESSFDTASQEILTSIQTLSEKLVKGSEIATRILMTYRVSINIQIPYNVIVCNPDDMNLLRNALEMDCSNKLEVVHDYILIHKWNKNQVSDLICEEIINHLSCHIKNKTEYPIMWDLNLNSDFHYILRLFQDDCSILGHKIFAYARTLYRSHMTSNMNMKISDMAFIIEIIIRAHDCFSADCNMEGISAILSKCQKIIMHLVTFRSWKLIVRLLTAIARYSEMNYVFQILKENDQFEFLLMKGSRQDSALKIALLEYLKRYNSDNRDLYKMVALHFALFSEVAQLWERDAQSVIKNLIGISKLEMQNDKINPDTEPYVIFTNTDGTRLCLSKAMENYTHATEFHLQGEKLSKAMHTAKQAELLAVQLSLFNGLPSSATAICILDLEHSQITNLISSLLSFEQSLILVEAYNFATDWSSVLFSQCILQNNMVYIEHFLNHLPLTETITRDICRKFLSNFYNLTKEGVSNMKVILNKLPSVHAKYQIASELGFSDIVEDLITTGQLCYLKDTVWKRGYKNT